MLDLEQFVHWFDESILIVNKPSGLLSIPDGYNPDKPHLRTVLEPQFSRLWIVHRLDRETSGLMVLARSREAHKALNQQFEQGIVNKAYLAVVYGKPAWSSLRLELPLLPDGDRYHRTRPDMTRGKPARTDFVRLSSSMSHSWLLAQLYTGRTHQIRAHCAALGHPVLGDWLYVRHPEGLTNSFKRVALHASRLQFQHPRLLTIWYLKQIPEKTCCACNCKNLRYGYC